MKGKSLEWFRGLPHSLVTDWDDLGDKLCKHFEEKSDHVSLLEKLTTIKRAPYEYMINYNYRFQKTWDRIPAIIKPTPGNAFLYYLKALNSDIAMSLYTMGGTTLPATYDLAIRVENTLIQASKLAPRPPMPLFPEMPTQVPTVAPIPIASTSQPLVVALVVASTSANETDKLETLMQNMMLGLEKKIQDQSSEIKKILQDQSSVVKQMGNELVTLKRKQA